MDYRIELHCHNYFSNTKGSKRFPLDSPMSPQQLLTAAYMAGLDAIIITNHNTLNGYKQMLDWQKDHPSLPMSKIKVFPGVETSAYLSEERDGHVLSYGISEDIPRNIPVAEVVDKTHSQGGITSAPHPAGMVSSIFNQAYLCDMIEVRNANNKDWYSDCRAHNMVKDLRSEGIYKPATVGSDAHFGWAVGRWTTTLKLPEKDIEDVDIDDVKSSLMGGNFVVKAGRYNSVDDIKKVIHYQLSDSPLPDGRRNDNKALLDSIEENFGSWARNIGKYFIDSFEKNPNVRWVRPAAWAFENRMKNISKKINVYGYSDSLMNDNWKKKVIESLLPLNKKKSMNDKAFKDLKRELEVYRNVLPWETVNRLNDEMRERKTPAVAGPTH